MPYQICHISICIAFSAGKNGALEMLQKADRKNLDPEKIRWTIISAELAAQYYYPTHDPIAMH